MKAPNMEIYIRQINARNIMFKYSVGNNAVADNTSFV